MKGRVWWFGEGLVELSEGGMGSELEEEMEE